MTTGGISPYSIVAFTSLSMDTFGSTMATIDVGSILTTFENALMSMTRSLWIGRVLLVEP